jgi:hypothetical protein
LLHQIPIFFHPSSVPLHNDFSVWCILELCCLVRWSLRKSCLTRQSSPYQKNVDKESIPFHNFCFGVWPIQSILLASKIGFINNFILRQPGTDFPYKMANYFNAKSVFNKPVLKEGRLQCVSGKIKASHLTGRVPGTGIEQI